MGSVSRSRRCADTVSKDSTPSRRRRAQLNLRLLDPYLDGWITFPQSASAKLPLHVQLRLLLRPRSSSLHRLLNPYLQHHAQIFQIHRRAPHHSRYSRLLLLLHFAQISLFCRYAPCRNQRGLRRYGIVTQSTSTNSTLFLLPYPTTVITAVFSSLPHRPLTRPT